MRPLVTRTTGSPDPEGSWTSRLCEEDLADLAGRREHHEDRGEGRDDADGDQNQSDQKCPADVEVFRAQCEVQSGAGRDGHCHAGDERDRGDPDHLGVLASWRPGVPTDVAEPDLDPARAIARGDVVAGAVQPVPSGP